MSNIFGGDDYDPADIEDEYISRVVPDEGIVLWIQSTEASPVWEDMTPEDRMTVADWYAEAIYSGSLDAAETFTDLLNIEWDDHDIRSFYEAYEAATG